MMRQLAKQAFGAEAPSFSGTLRPDTDRGAVSGKSSAVPAGVSARLSSTVPAVLALAAEWEQLEESCPNTVFFQSFAWCRNFIEFSQGDPSFSPRVITLHADGRMVGLLPLALQRSRGLSVLTGFAEPFQQYTDILLDPCADADALRPVLISALRKTGADYVHFGQVRKDSALARIAGDSVQVAGEEDGAPFVALSMHESHDAYLSTVKSKTRKNLRNARNRLERDAPVEHVVSHGGELLRQVVERAYEGREAWLERLGITSRAFQDSAFEAFLMRFAGNIGSTAAIDTIAMCLKHGENVLSDQWGFVYRGRYYAFMANWNPAYEASSPGRLHLGEVIRTCFEENIEIADFLIPASSYKLTWTDDVMPVSDRILPLTFKGWLYARLWIDLVRPRAKQVFYRLPAGLRQSIIKWMP